jgi:aromatic ring hydroxylase
MRTGAEYRQALHDGRRVWVMGHGWVADVAAHETTQAIVEEYALWYDRHRDPAWREALLSPGGSENAPLPWAYVAPRNAQDLIGMGRSFARTTFLGAGNITHTPAYGNLIALGVLTAAQAGGAPSEQIEAATAYRDKIASTGRFLTYCGGAPIIGQRLRPDPAQRVALELRRETTTGIVISGRLGMHTSPAFAEDVYVGPLSRLEVGGRPASFIVPVNAPGVTILCRRPATREEDPFLAPLSRRLDELDGQMWLDEVTIPWNRIFFVDPAPEAIARWLRWHHLYGWLAKAEVTFGLALALADAMGLRENAATVDYLIDLLVTVQTVRSALTAAERDPEFTPAGYCFPNHAHLAAGGIQLMRARAQMSDLLRIIPGSSLVVAPGDSDLNAPELAAGLEDSFGGGNYTARQRAALLQMAWDHASSALDGREAAFEAHASGGMPNWRHWLRRSFRDYDALANAVSGMLGLPMPKINLEPVRTAPIAPRRTAPPPPAASAKT